MLVAGAGSLTTAYGAESTTAPPSSSASPDSITELESGPEAVAGVTTEAVLLGPIVVDPNLDPPQPPPADGPAPRVGAGFAASPDGTYAVLYGGGDVFSGGPSLGDTWTWDGAAWTARCGTSVPGATTPCAPGTRDLVAEATAPTGVVLYGGERSDGSGTNTVLDDSYLWTGNEWQQLCSPCAPGPRAGAAAGGNGQSALLFGGGDTAGGSLFGDTWQFDGVAWTLANPGGGDQPVARLGASIAWDGTRFVLFGGLVPGPGGTQETVDETWLWDGAQWLQSCGQPAAPCGPTGRVLGGFAYLHGTHPSSRGALLVGGLGFADDGTPSILGDIWLWDGTTWHQQASPWPDETSLDGPPPSGLPFVGALAALPASCMVTLAGDFVDDTSGSATPTPGTWNVGFDTDGDGQPGPCAPDAPAVPASQPEPLTPTASGPTLPLTGSSIVAGGLAAGVVLLGIGSMLVATTRCTSRGRRALQR